MMRVWQIGSASGALNQSSFIGVFDSGLGGLSVLREIRARLPAEDLVYVADSAHVPYGGHDEAFIRQVSGINFNTPDTGWQVGYEGGPWSAQVAVTRGTAGGPEIDSGKQYSLRVSHVKTKWRAGASFNFNDARIGDRQMQNVFAGLVTGPVAWLAEIDYIIDDGTPTGRRKSWATLLEANYGYRRGHNLKATFEWYDPDKDVSEDEQTRISVVWEYTPIQFLQARFGYRNYSGIPQNPGQNREQLFAGNMRHSQVEQHDFNITAVKQRSDITAVVTANKIVHIC